MNPPCNPLAAAMRSASANVEHDQLVAFSRQAQAAAVFASLAPTDALIAEANELQLERLGGVAELPAGDAPRVSLKLAGVLRLMLQDTGDLVGETRRTELLLVVSALCDLLTIAVPAAPGGRLAVRILAGEGRA